MPAVDRQVFITLEAVPGTAQAVVLASAVHAKSCTFQRGQAAVARPMLTGDINTVPAYKPHSQMYSGSIELEWKAGTAIAAAHPELDTFLQCAGFVGVPDIGVKYQYKMCAEPLLASVNLSATLRKQEGPGGLGKEYKSHGAKFGNLTIGASVDQPLSVKADWLGGYNIPVDDAVLDVPAFAATLPFSQVATGGFLIGAIVPVCRSWSVQPGLVVEARGSQGAVADHGYKLPPNIFANGCVWTFEIEAEDEGVHALQGLADSGLTVGVLKVKYTDGTRSVSFDCPDARVQSIESVVGKPNMYSIVLNGHGNGTDYGFMITMT